MDLNALMGTLLGSDSIESISKLSGASEDEVKKVLGSAMPKMLSGAQDQATDEKTAEGFAKALSDHAQADTSDVRGFLSSVDQVDGAKIVAHLLSSLGSGSQGSTQVLQSAASSSGLKPGQVAQILAIAAPLLMSLLGKQDGKEDQSVGVGGLMGALLGKTDTASLVQTLLFGKKKRKGLLGLLLGGK